MQAQKAVNPFPAHIEMPPAKPTHGNLGGDFSRHKGLIEIVADLGEGSRDERVNPEAYGG